MEALVDLDIICPKCHKGLAHYDDELYWCIVEECELYHKILRVKTPPTIELELVSTKASVQEALSGYDPITTGRQIDK